VGQNAPLVFTGITTEQYKRLTARAHAAGIDLNGNSGTASKFGVKIAWNYSPETLDLTLHCLETPFFVQLSEVNARIQTLVNESRG
jgi:hypothetical protein